ncbi:glycosyltransferase family 4 protein [Sphingomonas sp. PB2P19]|uniref:glycosyltransferase family 4 protein n=1 Tax=Sphingomonas rhamnosi TaxID=3096156 RepID=UPI002FC9EEAC
MRICFYANLAAHPDRKELLRRIEFYRLDLELLRDLGHEVVEATRPSEVVWDADLYYSWWWGHAIVPLAIARLRRRPIIVTGAFDYATCRGEIPGLCYLERPAWQRSLMRIVLRSADTNLFISQYEYDEVTDHLPVRRPVALPLAIDTETYRPDLDPSTVREPYFFTVSLLTETNVRRKGVGTTIEAFARLADRFPEARLKIAGKHGDYIDVLRQRCAALNITSRVDFLGLIPEEEKLYHYHHCSAYVQPTLYEGFGHAIGEAVSCGTPVVTSLRGAVPEVVGPYGTCVDPHDLAALTEAMAAALGRAADPVSAEAAHQWIVDHFSIARRRERLSAAIGSVAR